MRLSRAVSLTPAHVPVLLLLLALLGASGSGLVHGRNLQPACSGQELSVKAVGGAEQTVARVNGQWTLLGIDCLALEVTSTTGPESGDKDGKKAVDECAIPHATEYDFDLVLRAERRDGLGRTITTDYSLRDLRGGSISAFIAHPSTPSSFSFVFKNRSPKTACVLRLRMLVNAAASAMVLDGVPAYPSLVGVAPSTVYVDDNRRTFIRLQYPPESNMSVTSQPGDVFLGPYAETGCLASSAEEHLPFVFDAFNESSAHPGELFATYSAQLTRPSDYMLCYRPAGAVAAAAASIAVLTAFGGNPAYYEITEGLDPSGALIVGTPVVIRFHGASLDTRPGKDTAKFVSEATTCDKGAPAGGVPQATDLGPADHYGPGTTYSEWRATVRQPGAYKVCYRRAAAAHWTEVPSIDEAAPGGAATTTTTAAPLPVPTDPNDGEPCPSAPSNIVWHDYKSAKLRLRKGTAASKALAAVAEVLCLAPAAVVPVMMPDAQTLYVSLDCAEPRVAAAAGAPICDRRERLVYLQYVATGGGSNETVIDKRLAAAGVIGVQCSTAVVINGGGSGSGSSSSAFRSTLLVCLTVLAVTGMVCYAVVKYNERRDYLGRFEIGDGDIDDMYAAGALPPDFVLDTRLPGDRSDDDDAMGGGGGGPTTGLLASDRYRQQQPQPQPPTGGADAYAAVYEPQQSSNAGDEAAGAAGAAGSTARQGRARNGNVDGPTAIIELED